MWKWINIAAWGVGGLLTILVACYWIYKDMKPLGYTYIISLEGTKANTIIKSPKYYQLMTLREDPESATPSTQPSLIADYSFLIRSSSPFKDGQPFEFTIIHTPSPPTTQTVPFKRTDCNGSICKASYRIVDNKLIRNSDEYTKSVIKIKPDAFLAQVTSFKSDAN